eukprot:sb/3478109/
MILLTRSYDSEGHPSKCERVCVSGLHHVPLTFSLVPGPVSHSTLHSSSGVTAPHVCYTQHHISSQVQAVSAVSYSLQVLTDIPIVVEQSSKQVDCFVGKGKRG